MSVPVWLNGRAAACLSLMWSAKFMSHEAFAMEYLAELQKVAENASVLLETAQLSIPGAAGPPNAAPGDDASR